MTGDIIAVVVAGSYLRRSFPQSSRFRRKPASIPVELVVECEADDKFSRWAQALAGPKSEFHVDADARSWSDNSVPKATPSLPLD
jgi:hypothetical protein